MQVSGLSNIIAIAAGGYHSLALRADGTVWAWGANALGQLGDGTHSSSSIPVQVSGLSNITAIAAGGQHSLALGSDGSVWAWGDNHSGQLGDGTFLTRMTPIQVSGLSGIVAIVGGEDHSLAMKADKSVWAWGNNYFGQLGRVTPSKTSPIPLRVLGLSSTTAIAAGNYHSLAIATYAPVSPPVIFSITRKTRPWRLILVGSNFHNPCTLQINGQTYGTLIWKSSTKVVAKGADLKAACPKGTTVQVTITNSDDGGTSTGYAFSW